MESMVERVGERLRKECLEVFGSTWNYDIAWRFARAAIDELREPTPEMFNGANRYMDSPSVNMAWWNAMLDAALKGKEDSAETLSGLQKSIKNTVETYLHSCGHLDERKTREIAEMVAAEATRQTEYLRPI